MWETETLLSPVVSLYRYSQTSRGGARGSLWDTWCEPKTAAKVKRGASLYRRKRKTVIFKWICWIFKQVFSISNRRMIYMLMNTRLRDLVRHTLDVRGERYVRRSRNMYLLTYYYYTGWRTIILYTWQIAHQVINQKLETCNDLNDKVAVKTAH